MDLDQIVKRIEWLDDERRKDKLIITALESKLSAMEGNIPALNKEISEVARDLARVSAALSRFDQIENSVVQVRVDLTRSVEAIEKTRAEHEREVEKVRYADLESINKSIADVRKGLDPIPDLKKSIQGHTEEEFRLGRLIEELEHKFLENARADEEYRRAQKVLEEGRRQDAKRISDLQGEVATLRKRVDEQRGKVDVSVDSVRKIEIRIADLQAAESERRQAQVAFIEKQNMLLVERERIWKEWQVRFDEITGRASGVDTQIQALETTHRAVKRSQEAMDEVTLRFERRVNEITEMQRLVEERFRQEWVTFKADDQKRWTNYSLAQEEQQREITRQFEKNLARIAIVEDASQEGHELMLRIIEDNQKRLQAIVALMHQTMDDFDQAFGRMG